MDVLIIYKQDKSLEKPKSVIWKEYIQGRIKIIVCLLFKKLVALVYFEHRNVR